MKTHELYETVVNYQKENKVFFKNAENWALREFKDMYDEGAIKLQDWFQRDYCWDKNQVSALVHTMINTPTLLPEVVLIKIGDIHYVADGHQRLRSLLLEVLGNPDFKYSSKELTSFTKFHNVTPNNVNWKSFERALLRTQIGVKVIQDINMDEQELRNLKSYVFRKWNNGKSVNAAEKRGSFPSDLNILLVQGLKEDTDDEIQKSLLVSNSIGRNKFNELIEKLFYHFIYPDATRDPKREDFERLHSLDFESINGKVNRFRKIFKVMSQVVHEYKLKNGKFWGSCSLRDVMTFVNSLYAKNEFQNITQYREYLVSLLDTIQTTYVKNNKFDSYKKGIQEEQTDELATMWYKEFFSYYGKGQDGKFNDRRDFLNCKKDLFGSLGNNDDKRIFNTFQRQSKFVEQNRKCCGVNGEPCKHTNGEVSITELEADHIIEYSVGGTTTIDNLQMLCKQCHKEKTKQFITKDKQIEVLV